MSNYWKDRRFGRRSVMRGVGLAGAGAASLALVGCGDDDDDDDATPAAGSTSPAASGSPASSPAAAQIPRGGTLKRGTYLNVLGIDPHIEVSVGLYMMASVYNYLGQINPVDQKFTPMHALSYEQPTPTEITFKLRQGVKYQSKEPVNGREITAQDVLYSMERFRDHPKAQNNDFYKSIVSKMEAPDNYTFKVTLKQPWAEALGELGGPQRAIVPREAVEKFTDLSTNAIGGGPFQLKEYVKGERTVLEKNPDYWDKANKPYLDGVEWKTVLDLSTLLQAFKSGQIDIGSGPYEGLLSNLTKLDFEELKKNDKMETFKIDWLSYGSLGLNASVKPFDDPRVRQALWLGMDRKQFVDKLGLGEGTPQGILSSGLSYWTLSQEELKPYIGYDPKKAKELLTAAGYGNGFEFEVDTSNGVPSYIDHAELMVAELKKLDITMKLKIIDLPTFLSEKLFKANFNAVVFTHNPYEAPKIPLGFYHKNGIGTFSWWHYDNPKVTAAVDAQNAEVDSTRRQKLVKDAQKLILEDGGPMINIFTRVLFQAWYKKVGGFDPTIRTFQYFTYNEHLKPT